ncbi:MAG: 4-alpha-glucanotransferase, partial [Chitinophagaceae bacterium]
KGIILKGDIPIGIYRFGCDAWTAPGLYNMLQQAGAPPDDFAVKGQNWGFPTYNWKKMQEDHFDWWRKRFEQMSYYFDAFRIDHILGFFRIWSIPMDAVEGIMGHFVPAIPVNITEFGERGIWFDHHRYCKPYITDEVLNKVFGELAAKVKSELVVPNDFGSYDLELTFETQRQVEEYFLHQEPSEENNKLKQGLFDLISNVILFEDEEEESKGKKFHFRIAVESTMSFRHLDWQVQQKLKDLYVNYFFRRQDGFWMKEAMHKLPYLKRATNMLICGEDLGMVPHCVSDVMNQLGILSLEIQRMPKATDRKFFHPNDAPYMSVVTPSTHDMSTIRGWWEEDRQTSQQFFNHELGQWGEAPVYCEPWINRAVVLQHLYSPGMWSIFLLQDILGMSEKLRRENPLEERINVPANPNHYWRYRMHMNLEELIKEKEFNHELKGYIVHSGR